MARTNNAAAYALDKRDHDLFASLNYGKFFLMTLPDNEQGAFLQNMLDRVQGVVGYLDDYNVTDAGIADAQAAVTKIKEGMTDPRAAIDKKAAATKTIPQYEADSRNAIAKMDRLLHNFRDANPDFVRVFRQARIIVDAGRRHDGNDSGSEGEDNSANGGTPGAAA